MNYKKILLLLCLSSQLFCLQDDMHNQSQKFTEGALALAGCYCIASGLMVKYKRYATPATNAFNQDSLADQEMRYGLSDRYAGTGIMVTGFIFLSTAATSYFSSDPSQPK